MNIYRNIGSFCQDSFGHKSNLSSIYIYDDSIRILTADEKGTLILWNLFNGEKITQFQSECKRKIIKIHLVEKNNEILIISDKGEVVFLSFFENVFIQKKVVQLPLNEDQVIGQLFLINDDLECVYSCVPFLGSNTECDFKKINIKNTNDDCISFSVTPKTNRFTELLKKRIFDFFIPIDQNSNLLIASRNYNGTFIRSRLNIWEIESERRVKKNYRNREHIDFSRSAVTKMISFDFDQKVLVGGAWRCIDIWDLRSLRSVKIIEILGRQILDFEIIDESFIAFGLDDERRIYCWNLDLLSNTKSELIYTLDIDASNIKLYNNNRNLICFNEKGEYQIVSCMQMKF